MAWTPKHTMKREGGPVSGVRSIVIADAFRNEPPQLDFVLPGFLRGTVGILTSAGGLGKSFWAMEACMGIASPLANKALLDLPLAAHGPVLIINAEDPSNVLNIRLHAIGQHLSQEARDEVCNNLIIKPVFGQGLCMGDVPTAQDVAGLARDLGARLIVLDTLSRLKGTLDENSNSDMAQYMNSLEYIAAHSGASVVSLHHVSKSMAINGRQDEQQSVRGASLLVDNARWQAWMGGMSPEDAKKLKIEDAMRKHYVQWGISKQNYGSPMADVWLRKHEGGVQKPAMFEKGGWDE